MTQYSVNQKSILKVYLNDLPEFPRLFFNLNPHSATQDIIHHSEQKIRADSKLECRYLYGGDITIRFATYSMKSDKMMMYSIPSQPVVKFHIQLSGSCGARFLKKQNQSHYNQHQCSLFWQNEDILTYELPQGESAHIDLYFRPTYFLALADRYPALSGLVADIAEDSEGKLDFFVGMADDSVLDLIDDIMLESSSYQVSQQRFIHLCECLLLRSMRIPVSVEQRRSDAVKRTADVDTSYRNEYAFTNEQKLSLESLNIFGRKELINEFNTLKQDYLSRKEGIENYKVDIQRITSCYSDIVGNSPVALAKSYFWMAQQLDQQMKRFTLTEEEEGTMIAAIIAVCDQSFELCRPNADQLAFYTKYTRQPYVGELGMEEFGRLLNNFVPDLNLPLDKLDSSKASHAIFGQYLQDRLKFTSLSAFHGKKEKDKPEEVVALYHMLMRSMTDEFTITDTGGIKKSDVIRILDHAYQEDDLLLLLMVEIDHLADHENYVERQSFDKIRLWVVALEEALDEMDNLPSPADEKLPSHLIDVYYTSADKLKAVERESKSLKDINDKIADILLSVGDALDSNEDKDVLLMSAASLTVAAQK